MDVTKEDIDEAERKIREGRERALRLRARLAAGEGETEAAHAEGFLTSGDVQRLSPRVAAILRRNS